jgi:hypothetical protein
MATHNPYIVILVLEGADGKPTYRAVSLADPTIRGYRSVLNTVFQFIRYDPDRPLQTSTTYGPLVEACVRTCSVPLEKRDPAVQFSMRASGIVGRSIVAHTAVHDTQETYTVAEHFTLF